MSDDFSKFIEELSVSQKVRDMDISDIKIDDLSSDDIDNALLGIEKEKDVSVKEKRKSIYTLLDILEKMVNMKASDLHIDSSGIIALRVHGEIERIEDQYKGLTGEQIEDLLLGVLSTDLREIFDTKGEVDYAYAPKDFSHRFRVNFFKFQKGVGAAFRIIANEAPRLEVLKLPPVVEKIAKYKRGLVIVTGPTGSGKSTTLAAIINKINEYRKCHIICIEDPIEFVHRSNVSLINHREVGKDALSFAEAVRAAIRENPDVLLVGEMRDLETASQAIKASETGLLVFGTLHTNNAAKAIERLIDMFPPEEQEQIRAMLSDSLRAIVAQQLMRVKDGKGRRGAYEVLICNSGVKSLIRERKNAQIPTMIETGKNQGMISMDESLAKLVMEDVIEAEVAKHYMVDPQILDYYAEKDD